MNEPKKTLYVDDIEEFKKEKADEFLKNINIEKFQWAWDTIKYFNFEEQENLNKYHNFITTTTEHNQEIEISSIIGTEHADYGMRKNWISMLYFAKRMHLVLEKYKENPDYYFLKKRKKGDLCYSTINGRDYYIADDGNHRTVIAKFILSQVNEKRLYGIDIKRYDINYEFYEAYKKLQSFCKKNKCFSVFSEAKNNVSSVILQDENLGKSFRFFTSDEIYNFLKKEDNVFKNILRKL